METDGKWTWMKWMKKERNRKGCMDSVDMIFGGFTSIDHATRQVWSGVGVYATIHTTLATPFKSNDVSKLHATNPHCYR